MKWLWHFTSFFWPRKGIKQDKLRAIYTKMYVLSPLVLGPIGAAVLTHASSLSRSSRAASANAAANSSTSAPPPPVAAPAGPAPPRPETNGEPAAKKLRVEP